MNEKIELLRAYKLQNPAKYLQKFGDKSPEEAAGQVVLGKPASTVLGVKVDFGEKKEKELDFLPTPPVIEVVKRKPKIKE